MTYLIEWLTLFDDLFDLKTDSVKYEEVFLRNKLVLFSRLTNMINTVDAVCAVLTVRSFDSNKWWILNPAVNTDLVMNLELWSCVSCVQKKKKMKMIKRAADFIQKRTPSVDSNEGNGKSWIPRVYTEPYFYGRITRKECDIILTNNGKSDGLYLLRESITPMGNFSLSLVSDDR